MVLRTDIDTLHLKVNTQVRCQILTWYVKENIFKYKRSTDEKNLEVKSTSHRDVLLFRPKR